MNNTWSDRLIEETRDVLDLGFVPRDDFVHMKNINGNWGKKGGNFGKIGLQNWLDRKLIIQDKETDAEYFYATVDELIAAGWAVD